MSIPSSLLRRIALLPMLALAFAGQQPSQVVAEDFRQLRIGGTQVQWRPALSGAPITLRFAIADRRISTPGAINCSVMAPPERLLAGSDLTAVELRRAAKLAFERWSQVADISFIETRDATTAQIVIGEQAAPRGMAFTNLTLTQTSPGTSAIVGAQICLNPARRWKLGYDGNLAVYDLVHTLTHEIGHAIGLDHPGARGHLMAFRYLEDREGLSAGDALGAVTLYGPARRFVTLVSRDGRAERTQPATLMITTRKPE